VILRQLAKEVLEQVVIVQGVSGFVQQQGQSQRLLLVLVMLV
jgi:hypothetical protein